MKIAMLLGRGTSSAILANAVRRWYPGAELCLIVEEPVSKRAMLQYRRRRLGTLAVVGQLLFQAGAIPLLRIASARRVSEILATYDLDDSSSGLADAHEVASINLPVVSARLRAFDPNVVLVNGTRIIKESILTCVRAPFVNTHVGITPLYRGVHGGYWALWNNDCDNFGVTVHLVDPGVDTGAPVGQVRMKPTRADTFVTYPLLQQAHALGVIKALIDGLPESVRGLAAAPEGEQSRQWFHPTLTQYLLGRLRGIK